MFSHETRQKNIQKLKDEIFDILVIGGGITGAGVVRDAAMRGYKTVLIEKTDFAAGTSSKSSKLIHGGFRYLQHGEIGLVRESLWERKTLMNTAPHLVQPQKCLIPIYNDSPFSSFSLNIGLWLYDLLAFTKNIGKRRMVSADELRQIQPEIRNDGLKKGAEYSDCTADDYRLVISTIISAAEHGAIIANYVKANSIIKDNGKINGIEATDELTGERIHIRSRIIVNATGPWSDEVREILFQKINRKIRTTKGIHVIVHRDDLPLNRIFMVFSPIDQRPVLSIPWKNFVILGTTDTDYTGNHDNVPIEKNDVDYILQSFSYYFPNSNLSYDKIVSTFCGLRALIIEEGKRPEDVTREYEIFEGPDNFFSIIGGKLTTYRTMSKEIVDKVSKCLKKRFQIYPKDPTCRTGTIPLFGGGIDDYNSFYLQWKTDLTQKQSFDEDVADHLIETYGSQIETVSKTIDTVPDGRERILPNLPYVWGELPYAINYEMCVALDDFLIRRTHLFSLDNQQGLNVYKEIEHRLAQHLGWSLNEREAQVQRYKHKIDLTRHYQKEITREDTLHR